MSSTFETAYQDFISTVEAEFEKMPTAELAIKLATCWGKDQYGFFVHRTGIGYEGMGSPMVEQYVVVGWGDDQLEIENAMPDPDGYGITATDVGYSELGDFDLVISHVRLPQTALRLACEIINRRITEQKWRADDDGSEH